MTKRTLSREAKRLEPFLNLPRKAITGGRSDALTAHSAQEYDAAHGTNAANARVHHSIKYGIIGGSGVDESANLEAMIDTVGLAGGGKIIVRAATNGNAIRLDNLAGIYHSGIDLEFQSPVSLGAGGGVRAMGTMVEEVRNEPFAAGLDVDASVGDTTITLKPTAGKMQASDFLDGDLVTIRGENNAKGEALTKQILTIVSRNTGANTITFAEELEFDFLTVYPSSAYGATDATTIFLNKKWSLAADVARGAMTATVTDSTGMAVGKMVRLYDSRVEIDLNPAAIRSGGAGPYENECRLEYRIITYIDSGTHTVTFDKPISKGYLQGSPYFGGIAEVAPVENVHIRGINLTYYEPQTDRNIHAISLNFAKDSTIEDCNVNGIGGGMGQQYRISDSYNCWGYRSIGRDPLYHDSAEGYIFALYKSDASGWRHCLASGGRHNFLVQAATNFTIDSCQSYDSWISGIDTHGVDEYDGLITNCLMSQTNKAAPGVTNRTCARNGNTSHTVGSHWIVWQNCVFFGNPDTNVYGLDILAASTHVIIDSCKFFGGDYGIRNSKNPSQCTPTQTVSDLTIRDCEFHNIAVRPVYLEGIPDTATGTRSSGKLDYVLLDGNITWNCTQHFHVSGGDAITNLTVSRNRTIRPVTSPGNDYYGLVITDTDGLMVEGNNFHLCSRGISLLDATNACIIGNTLTATIDAIPITLAGTNTGPGGGALIYVANIVDNSSVGAAGIPATIVDVKGDLIAATAADTVARLAAGANDTILVADSAQTAGLRWATPAQLAAIVYAASGAFPGAITATSATVDGTIRVRQTGATRYRSDWGVSSAITTINSYDDTGAVYIPLNLDVLSLNVRPSGSTMLLVSASGVAASGVITSPGATVDGSVRVRQSGSTRYRSDYNVGSATPTINAYDDTGSVYLPFNFDVLSLNVRPSGSGTMFAVSSAGGVMDGQMRMRQAGNTRYRSDHIVAAATTTINSFDDTGAAYIPLNVDASTISLRPNASAGLVVSSTGVAVTGDLSVSGNFGGWTLFTYNTDWSDYNSSNSPGRYRKVGDIVYVEGFVKRASSGTSTLITTMAYGPVKDKHFVTDTNSATLSGRIEITSAGTITLIEPTFGSPATIGYVCLDGIVFSTT